MNSESTFSSSHQLLTSASSLVGPQVVPVSTRTRADGQHKTKPTVLPTVGINSSVGTDVGVPRSHLRSRSSSCRRWTTPLGVCIDLDGSHVGQVSAVPLTVSSSPSSSSSSPPSPSSTLLSSALFARSQARALRLALVLALSLAARIGSIGRPTHNPSSLRALPLVHTRVGPGTSVAMTVGDHDCYAWQPYNEDAINTAKTTLIVNDGAPIVRTVVVWCDLQNNAAVVWCMARGCQRW